MSLRWRIDGRLLCAAKCDEEPDDTYIDDRLHYHLSLTGVIEPEPDEAATGLWKWREARAPYWDMSLEDAIREISAHRQDRDVLIQDEIIVRDPTALD